MLLETAEPTFLTQFQTSKPEPQHKSRDPVTPYSLTLVLAYLHYYTPEMLPKGRLISPTHLRLLAQWIGHPRPQLRSIRQHRLLAAHIAILHTAGFMSLTGAKVITQPAITPWLYASLPDKIAQLQEAIACSSSWMQSVSEIGLQETLPIDYVTYLQQSLERQYTTPPSETSQATWADTVLGEIWQLELPHTLPLWLHFELRQLGTWSPGQPLTCTPLTIAQAVQHGYGHDTIRWFLETATGHPLTAAQLTQLHLWCRRAQVYHLRTVHLLSVPHPGYLEPLRRRKEFRSAIIEQLSPRHLAVSTEIMPTLSKWLAAHGYPLYQHPPQVDKAAMELEPTYQWLGLRILIGLGSIITLPCPSPHTLLDDLSEQLAETTKSDLEATAVHILEQLREAIHGRDAFFPAQDPSSPTLLSRLQQAIAQEATLTITYQALGDRKPTARQIQPLHLEKRGELFYLTAYCFRAEMNLTFRLDRIHDWE